MNLFKQTAALYLSSIFTNKVASEEIEAIIMGESTMQKAAEMESMFAKEQILRREREQREKAIMDYNSAMSASFRIGYNKGLEDGRREAEITRMALAMLEDHLPIEDIAKYTDTPVDKLREWIGRKV